MQTTDWVWSGLNYSLEIFHIFNFDIYYFLLKNVKMINLLNLKNELKILNKFKSNFMCDLNTSQSGHFNF